MTLKCILHYLSSTTVVIDETTISFKRYYCNANKGEVENILC